MVELEIDKASLKNLNKNMDIIKKEYPKEAWKMVVKMLFDMKFLAQQKLKGDKHIVTSRLRNSIVVKTPKRSESDDLNYQDNKGNSFDADLKSVKLEQDEGVFGTNVEYAGKIEFLYDSFIYWASKHVNVRKRVTELAKELRAIKFVR